MKNKAHWINSPFDTNFINTVSLLNHSISNIGSDNENLFAVQAILNAVFTLESIGNCLLESLNLPKKIIEEIDKFKILSKFEYVLFERTKKYLNYGIIETQNINELISIRNKLAHSKANKAEGIIIEPEDTNSDEEFIETSNPRYNFTKISKNSRKWNVEDAKIGIKSMLDFLNYYFNETGYTNEEISIILLDKKYDEKGIGTWMIDVKINESFEILNAIYETKITPFIKIEGLGTYTIKSTLTEES